MARRSRSERTPPQALPIAERHVSGAGLDAWREAFQPWPQLCEQLRQAGCRSDDHRITNRRANDLLRRAESRHVAETVADLWFGDPEHGRLVSQLRTYRSLIRRQRLRERRAGELAGTYGPWLAWNETRESITPERLRSWRAARALDHLGERWERAVPEPPMLVVYGPETEWSLRGWRDGSYADSPDGLAGAQRDQRDIARQAPFQPRKRKGGAAQVPPVIAAASWMLRETAAGRWIPGDPSGIRGITAEEHTAMLCHLAEHPHYQLTGRHVWVFSVSPAQDRWQWWPETEYRLVSVERPDVDHLVNVDVVEKGRGVFALDI